MTTSRPLQFCLSVLTLSFGLLGSVPVARAVGFQPPNPEELKMTAEPKAPGAPAIILFREVDRDDRGLTAHEDVYFRIKILTEEGRKYADIEIPFRKDLGTIINVHGRTVRPDGSTANFEGKVFEQTIVKARGIKYLAKTFTLPDVHIGSVIEYYYTNDLPEYIIEDSHWILSHELYTKSARFTLKPYEGEGWNVRWIWSNLPTGTSQPAQAPNHVISLDVANVPAFPIEDYMPPENELKGRVDFIYSDEIFEKDPDKYWKKRGKKLNDSMESFVGKRKAMEQAVAEIVAPADPPEVKLQKIYTRVQQLRNTSFEQDKTEQEQKRSKEKEADNVEAVWKKQYANGYAITWLFLGLARAAGLEASGMWVSNRRDYFFTPRTMEGRRLDENVVIVKLNGKDLFFDPGYAFVPFGMLPWSETAVPGLRLDKDGGTWMQTTLPPSADSGVKRKAQLKLSDTGDLEGTMTVTCSGLEASQRRLEERLADETERKKYLEDEVKNSIPVVSEVELTNKPEWKTSSVPLVAEFTIKVPGWVSGAGRRALLPVGLFSAEEKHLFDHAERVHPIYFEYPFERADDINIELPLGWSISTVPKAEKLDAKAIVYSLLAENNKSTLHIQRSLNVDIIQLSVDRYTALRQIFQTVRTVDEEQAVLQPGAASASN